MIFFVNFNNSPIFCNHCLLLDFFLIARPSAYNNPLINYKGLSCAKKKSEGRGKKNRVCFRNDIGILEGFILVSNYIYRVFYHICVSIMFSSIFKKKINKRKSRQLVLIHSMQLIEFPSIISIWSSYVIYSRLYQLQLYILSCNEISF